MNWGLLGYGNITPNFATSLKQVEGQNISAIASFSNAGKLVGEYPDANIYNNYDELYADKGVDIVYIGTTHNFHVDNVINCLENGKHVLCEKPMGINPEEAQRMIDCAKKNNLFLMEGLWMCFLPAYRYMMEVVRSGEIGEVKLVRADFGFLFPRDDSHRVWNPKLAGGSLLDLGVYPIALVNDVFGMMPESITVAANTVDTGVDESIAAQFQYATGASAQIYSALSSTTHGQAIIYGERGWIQLDEFYMGQNLKLNIDGKIKELSLPFVSTGYFHEIEEAVKSIESGKIESQLFSHQDSMMNANVVQQIFNEIK